MSQYSASVPNDGQVRPEIHSFFERFYRVSDSPEAHEAYADMFTHDAKLVMVSNVAVGREAIIQMRHAMWEKVASRSHRPQQLYAFGHGGDEVMLYGTVAYQLKDGKGTTVEWAARAQFVQEAGELRMGFYQVYLDSAAMSKAK